MSTLPEGYEIEHEAGGYYWLTAPDGERVEGPVNGKWHGRDAAEAAASEHAAPAPDTEALSERYNVPVGLWHGLPNYHCPNEGCGFAHLDVQEVYEHARGCRR